MVESYSLGKKRTPITSSDSKLSIVTLSNCFECPFAHVEQLFPIAIVHVVFVHVCSVYWLHVPWCGCPQRCKQDWNEIRSAAVKLLISLLPLPLHFQEVTIPSKCCTFTGSN